MEQHPGEYHHTQYCEHYRARVKKRLLTAPGASRRTFSWAPVLATLRILVKS